MGGVVQNDKGKAHKGLANDGKDMGRGDIIIIRLFTSPFSP